MPDSDWTIKPSGFKAALGKLFILFGILFLIGGAAIMLHFIVGLDIFLTPLETFEIEADFGQLAMFGVLGVFIVGAVMALLGYVSVAGQSYQFYAKLFVAGKEQIPYKNVVKVTCNTDGLLKTILGYGDITIELTGLSKDKIVIQKVNEAQRRTQMISSLVQRVNAMQQAQFTEENKINAIMNKF